MRFRTLRLRPMRFLYIIFLAIIAVIVYNWTTLIFGVLLLIDIETKKKYQNIKIK